MIVKESKQQGSHPAYAFRSHQGKNIYLGFLKKIEKKLNFTVTIG